MSAKIGKLRGTRDFAPEDVKKRKDLESRMRRVFENYGYEEVQTPTMEPLELFLLKSGEAVIEETYNFRDKGGREICLVPERTAPTIRFYVNDLQRVEKPLRLYYFENCFRYEKPQKARYREFWQFGAEFIGITDRARANAELIALACSAIKEAGIETKVRIGDLDILRPAVKACNCDETKLMRAIDKGDIEVVESNAELKALLQCKNVEEIRGYEKEKELLKRIFEYLKIVGIEVELDLGIARGLDYYFGMVFEIDCQSLGAEKQVAGGGEYSLIELFGGKDVGSSGFAIGFDRVVEAANIKDIRERNGVFLIPLSKNSYESLLKIAKNLRARGIRCGMEINNRRAEKALAYADSKDYKYAILKGEREEESKVALKDLETGEQRVVAIEELEIILSAEK
jgi:histidyl-tRNA synthetase